MIMVFCVSCYISTSSAIGGYMYYNNHKTPPIVKKKIPTSCTNIKTNDYIKGSNTSIYFINTNNKLIHVPQSGYYSNVKSVSPKCIEDFGGSNVVVRSH